MQKFRNNVIWTTVLTALAGVCLGLLSLYFAAAGSGAMCRFYLKDPLLPALNVARKKAYSINCIGNLRQQGVSFMLYNDNYEGYFPVYGMKRDTKDITWINLLLENGGITVKTIGDPGLKAVIAQDKTYAGYSYSGYGYNFRYGT